MLCKSVNAGRVVGPRYATAASLSRVFESVKAGANANKALKRRGCREENSMLVYDEL